MINDGWGKAKGWGKPVPFKEAVPASEEEIAQGKVWTTQQAVDKAVEILNKDSTGTKNITASQAADLAEESILDTGPGGVANALNLADPAPTLKAIEDAILKPMVEAVKTDITNPNEGWEVWPNKTTYIEPVKSSEEITNEVMAFREIEFLLAREVKLNLNSKLFAIDAIQVGDLAIWDDGEFFAISHVPTLAKFMNAVPTEDDKEYPHDSLVLWCTKVQRSHHEEWKTLRALTPQNHSTKNEAAFEAALRLREWCLSVPIE